MRDRTTTLLTALLMLTMALSGCHEPSPANATTDNGDDQGDQLPDGTGGDDDTRPADGEQPPGDEFQEDLQNGLHLSGTIKPCADGHCINATATNEGTTTYHISDICVEPFSETMSKDGDRVQHREPMFVCEAFGTRPFEHNEVIHHDTSWDGRLWNDDDNGFADAPSGTYAWTIHFRAYAEADGGESVELTITFEVEIG